MSIDAAAGSIAPHQSPPAGSPDSGSTPHRSAVEEHGGEPPFGGGYAAAAAPPFPQTLGFLLDVRISVSVEVGRVQMPVRQIMELGPGAVIELQRSASEPVEIHANGKCIGRGEIVVVGEQFGVRITELGPP
jgi:flagellar motor switch protein FliN/FliY